MRFNIRRLRSGAAKSAMVGVTALAVLLPAGLAAAATTQHATTARQLPAATFTWHKLTLLNGWKAYGNGDATPEYAISGGVVYLSGSLRQPAGSSNWFAQLPRAARPAHDLAIAVYTLGGITGTVQIGANGDSIANSDPYANAQIYTSLATISYPRTS